MPSPETEDLAALARHTQEVYERNAARFDAERPKVLFERTWLERFCDGLPADGHVLDLGCGTGDPIAAFLRNRGFRVTGLDASRAMLDLARRRCPDGDWRFGDMRTLDLPERFDGLLAWDSFFHLTAEEQRGCLPRFAAHLRPGGRLLLTVGPEAGEVEGRVGDDRVYHASLAPEEYETILATHGLRVLRFQPEDPDCGHHTVLLAQKAGATVE